MPRLYKSSIVIGTVVALLLVLIEIPGRVVSGDIGGEPSMVFEHGWPWVYLRRETVERPVLVPFTTPEGLSLVLSFDPSVSTLDVRSDLPHWGVPWLSAANWRFWQADREIEPPHWVFNTVIMLCDIATALIVATIIVGAWEFRCRRRPRLLSFRLADIFVAVTALCAALGWLAYCEREFQREALITSNSMFDGTIASTKFWDQVCIAPNWIQSLIGERVLPSFLWRNEEVMITSDDAQAVTHVSSEIAQLAYVSKIEIYSVVDKPFPFSALRAIERMDKLDIWQYRPLDERDVFELAQLTTLHKLVVSDKGDIAPAVHSSLEAKLPNCRIVDFDDDW